MAFDAGAITSTIGIDVSPFAKGMLQVGEISKEFPEIVTAYIAEPILGVIETLKEGAEEVAEFFKMVAETARGLNEVGEAAEKAGVSTQFLSGIGKAFENAGSSTDGLSESMKFLNKSIAEVVRGVSGSDRTAQVFRELGISYNFLRQNMNNSEAVFYKVADGVQAIQSPAERTRVLMELLSRGGADAAGAFSKGSQGLKAFASDMEKLGGTVDEKQASIAHSFVTLSSYLDTAFEGIKRAASEPILDALQAHFGDAKTGIIQITDLIENQVKSSIQGAVTYIESHQGEIKQDLKEIGAIIDAWVPSLARVIEAAQEALDTLGSLADLIGETDPNKRVEVKDPYAKNSIGDLSPDAVARHGAAGIAQLQTLGKSLDSVKDPLSELLAKLPDDNYDSGFNILSPDQLVQSVATAAGVDDAKKKMDAALGAATAGDPASIAAATDSVKAFRSAMDGAAQLVTNWQDDLGWGIRNFTASDGRGLNSGATGDKSYGVFSDIISQYQEAMRHAGGAAAGIRAGGEGLPVMANANAGAAPGAGNTIASAGSGVFSNSTLTAAAVLSSFSDKANSLAQQFGTLAASAAQLNPAFASLLQASNSSSLALPSSQSSNPLGGRNITNVNVGSVNVPPLDVREASSQIASKFVPILQQLSNQQRRQLESATQASLTLGGL